MVIFVDTSAFYALMDADDSNHETARIAWTGWLEQPIHFATSNYVLLESIALIQRRLGIEAACQFQEALVPLLQVHWGTSDWHAAAIKTLFAARRRYLSLVDCTSFELMQRLGLHTVFAFDRHFAEQGFTVLPAANG